MSATGALMIRLKKGPMDLDFAKDYIEQTLSDKEKGYFIKINKAYLTWPEVAAPLLIDLKGVKIIQENNPALSVNQFAFSVSGIGLLKGKILPSKIIISNTVLRLFNEDGSYNSFWQTDKKEVYGPIRPINIRDNLKDILAQVTDPKYSNIKTYSALKKIQLKNIIFNDGKNEKLATLNLLLEKQAAGIVGDLNINYPEKEGKSAVFKSEILYRNAQKDLTFSANLKDLHTSHIAPFIKDLDVVTNQNLFLNGDIKAAFDKNLKLQLGTFKLNVPEGQFNFPELYDEPLIIKDFLLNTYFNRADKKIEVSALKANVAGIPIEATLKGEIEKGHLIAPLIVNIIQTKPEDLAVLLSKAEKDSPIGMWIGHKLSEGILSNIIFTTGLDLRRNKQTKKFDLDINKPKMTFDFKNMTVAYSHTLTPVKKSDGRGKYEGDALTIEGDIGYIGEVIGRNVKLTITNLSKAGGGMADLSVDASGPLKSALDYVSKEPINAGSNLGFDPKTVQGNVDFNLELQFPTIKDLPKEQVKVKLSGKANDLVLPDVVRGLSLTGGPYDLAFNDGAISLKGKGKLDSRDIDLEWLQYLDSTGKDFETKISAKISADESLRKVFGIGLTEYIRGAIPVDVTYIDQGVKATVDVKGDLTPAILTIKPFNYSKASGVKGTLRLKGYIEGQDIKRVEDLNIDTENFKISNGQLLFKKLNDGSTDIASGKIPSVTLGQSQLSVDFENMSAELLKIKAQAVVFDIAPFIKTDKKEAKTGQGTKEGQPMQITLSANAMLGDKGEKISDAKLYLELNKASEPTRIEMDAKIGAGNMSVRFIPDANGVRNFNMQSNDAGYTLKAFGLYDKMRGGTINIFGQPRKGSGVDDLYGSAQIRDFRIVKAPALAKLISATSIKGVGGLLNNEGVAFTKLQSDFEWKFRDDGNLLVVKEGRTSGNSLGLTFEGLVNMGTNNTDISGTIIPLSDMNKAVGKIPLIGDILTGGGDALFAATYSMKGQSSDPSVMINPLSVLAPGFLRKILFEGDVDAKVKREESKK